MKPIDNVKLSSSITVKKYREMEKAQDRGGLSKFINERLRERYITPVLTGKRNGFAIMACACLLIETLEAFHQGWESTDRKLSRQDISNACRPTDPKRNRVSASEVAFCYFFQRERGFADFLPCAEGFYQHVRCGILHQGETTGGWRFTRSLKAPLFDKTHKAVNAEKFLRTIDGSLKAYYARLSSAEWDGAEWVKFRKKMDAVIKNCA